jgi:hypothetical protein
MRTVWKFPVPMTETMVIAMPKGAQIVAFANQPETAYGTSDSLFLWAIVDTDAPTIDRHFQIVGTGNPAPPDGVYVGTVHMPPFVWHLFEIGGF